MKRIIEANFYPVLTWHPSWPRKQAEPLEPELWKETNEWDSGVILWIASPDKKVHEPIKYFEIKTPRQLEERLRELLKKNGVGFVEPPGD